VQKEQFNHKYYSYGDALWELARILHECDFVCLGSLDSAH